MAATAIMGAAGTDMAGAQESTSAIHTTTITMTTIITIATGGMDAGTARTRIRRNAMVTAKGSGLNRPEPLLRLQPAEHLFYVGH